MAKSITIIPLSGTDKQFGLRNSRGEYWFCKDSDKVGENIEAAIWPLIESPLKRRRVITITITEK